MIYYISILLLASIDGKMYSQESQNHGWRWAQQLYAEEIAGNRNDFNAFAHHQLFARLDSIERNQISNRSVALKIHQCAFEFTTTTENAQPVVRAQVHGCGWWTVCNCDRRGKFLISHRWRLFLPFLSLSLFLTPCIPFAAGFSCVAVTSLFYSIFFLFVATSEQQNKFHFSTIHILASNA